MDNSSKKKTSRAILGFQECAECKNMFIPASCHLYKKVIKGKTHLYCSYTCYRKMEKQLEENKKGRPDL